LGRTKETYPLRDGNDRSFPNDFQKEGHNLHERALSCLSPRDGLTIFVSRFYAEHAPFKMSDVGSLRQRFVKAIHVFNFDHEQRDSRRNQYYERQPKYFPKCSTLL
jgi:hypothetical protein